MPQKTKPSRQTRPKQSQDEQPGKEWKMTPRPRATPPVASGRKLENKVAIITGGDSGIGRAVAILFAREGANVAITHLKEEKDARETRRLVEEHERECWIFKGDLGDESNCRRAVEGAVDQFGRLDVLVNNAAEQHLTSDFRTLAARQLERTFRTNIFSYFFMTKAALEHMESGSAIVNSTSVTAYRGSPHLVDYAATKGAIVAFTRSLSAALVDDGIRVNGVAPGPVWTPLIPASFPADKVAEFGTQVPMGRAGDPAEIAPCYLFLACDDSSYMTGQVLHPNGGEIVNG